MEKIKKFFSEKLKNISPFTIIVGVLLFIYSLFLFILLLWGVSNSLKSVSEFRTNPMFLSKIFPWEWSWDNYSTVFNKFQIRRVTETGIKIVSMFDQIIYTLLYAGGCALINSFVICITSYACARYDFWFSKVLYTIVLITMMLPIVGSYPSELQILTNLGLYDTIWGNWIQKMNFLGPYFLVFHATFKSLSKEYIEAARIDGANEFTIFFKIVFPLVSLTFFTVVLIKFIEFWNDYQAPLLYMPSFPTLSVGIYHLSNSTTSGLSYVPMRLAGCIMLVLPIFVLFIIFKDRIIGNISMGGVKE